MIKYGEWQRMQAYKMSEYGMYLIEEGLAPRDREDAKVLLPYNQVTPELKPGDIIDVFLYKDSKDRPVATTNKPYLAMGQFAQLECVEVTEIGAFLDWGLEKDLFLPHREMTVPVQRGNRYLVALYLDKSKRLCATMKLYHLLKTGGPFVKDQQVAGTIYDKKEGLGYFVAVHNAYSGLIPMQEAYGKLYIGKEIKGRIIEVREDGRLTLAVRDKIPQQMDEDAETLIGLMETRDRRIPFNDRANPDIIYQYTGMSKAAFKRAVGRLLKQGLIEITDEAIILL